MDKRFSEKLSTIRTIARSLVMEPTIFQARGTAQKSKYLAARALVKETPLYAPSQHGHITQC